MITLRDVQDYVICAYRTDKAVTDPAAFVSACHIDQLDREFAHSLHFPPVGSKAEPSQATRFPEYSLAKAELDSHFPESGSLMKVGPKDVRVYFAIDKWQGYPTE